MRRGIASATSLPAFFLILAFGEVIEVDNAIRYRFLAHLPVVWLTARFKGRRLAHANACQHCQRASRVLCRRMLEIVWR